MQTSKDPRMVHTLLLIGLTALGLARAQPGDGPTSGRPSDGADAPTTDPCTHIDCPPGSKQTIHSHPNSCIKYYECRGNQRFERECTTGETFNLQANDCMPDHVCEIACSVTLCGVSFDCKTNNGPELNQTHPTDCSKYLQCEKQNLRILDCPSGNRFHSEALMCRPAVEVICIICNQPPVDPFNPTSAAGSGIESTPDPNAPGAITGGDTVAIGSRTTQAPTARAGRTATPAVQETVSASDQTSTGAEQATMTQPQGPDPQPTSVIPNVEVTTQAPAPLATTDAPTQVPPGPVATTAAASPQATTAVHVVDPFDPNPKPITFPPFHVLTSPIETTTTINVETTQTTDMSTSGQTAKETTASTVKEVSTTAPALTESTSEGSPSDTTTSAGVTQGAATTGVATAGPTQTVTSVRSTQGQTTQAMTNGGSMEPVTTAGATQGKSTSAAVVDISTTAGVNPETTGPAVKPTKPTPSGGEPTNSPVVTIPPVTIATTDPVLVHVIESASKQFSEGDPATFECNAFLPAKVLSENNIFQPQPKLIWKLRGDVLSEGGRLTIKTVDEFTTKETISSTLTIKDMRPTDSGLLECIIQSDDTIISETTFYLPVLGRPTVKLTVSRALVVPQETIEASCFVSVPPTGSHTPIPDPPVYWYKDGVFLGMSESGKIFMGLMVDDEDQSRIDELPKGGSQLTIRVRERTTISCSATNAAGSSDIASKVVNVVHPGEENLYCDEELLRGITWSRLLAGGELYENCHPLNAIGHARRVCGKVSNTTAQWKNPDYTECVTAEYVLTLRRVDKIGDILGPVNTTELTEVTKELEDLTGGPEPLLPGDLKTTVEVLEKIVEIRKDWSIDEPVPEQEVVAVTHTISNLLDDDNIGAWDDFEEDKAYVSVGIMKTVDSYAELLAKDMVAGEEKIINSNNVVLMIESMSKDHIVTVQFPKNNSGSSSQAWARETTDYIMVQRDTVEHIKDDVEGDTVTVSGAYYNNLNKILPTGKSAGVNSKVIAMTIHGLSLDAEMSPPVSMRFSLQKEYPTNMTNDCSFWNYIIPSRGAWSRVGCTAVTTEDNSIICECNHLTNFAMLVSAGPVSERHFYILSMISLVGCIISMVALLLTLFFYCSMWKAVKSHHAAVLINLCIALIIGNLLFIAGVQRTENEMVCTTIAVLLHYFWLAAFFIMMVEGIQLLLYIIYVFHVRRKRDTAVLLIAGWLVPAVIVGVSLAVTQLEGYGTEDACWLSSESGLLWAFVAPVLCVIAVNTVILIIVLKRACSAKIPTTKKKNKLRSAVWNIVVITPLLGITWVIGVFSVNEDTIAFQYIFAVSNCLQGLFIFIFHALCNKKLKEAASSSGGPATFSTIKPPLLNGKSKNDTDKKGRYTLKGESTPSHQKKTQSGSGPKTTLTAPQSRKSSKSSSLGGPTNGYAANGHVPRPANTGRSRSSMTMDLHSPPTTQNGHSSNFSTFIPESRMAVDLHSAPSVTRTESYSSGKKPNFNQQLSDGSEMGSDIVLPAPGPPKLMSPLENNNASNGRDDRGEARVSTVSSTLPPSPTTTTTDVSWTSDRDFERELLARTTSGTSA